MTSIRRGTLLLLLVAGACDRQSRETVRRWLLCIECVSGEMDAVLALGRRAIPPLKEALAGLSPSDSVSAITRFAADHQALTRWRSEHPAPAQPNLPDSTTYVNRYFSNLATSYQARAAAALHSLHTPESDDALKAFWERDSLLLHPGARRLVDSLVTP